jgi:four helix bundle protein
MQYEPFGFEKLDVWQKARRLASAIYGVTRRFPREEMFGLTTQLRRAGVSVAANIAEGTSRSSGKDQARFFEMAFGSLNEVATLLYIALDQEFITQDRLSALKSEIADIGRMLSGLRRTALERRR